MEIRDRAALERFAREHHVHYDVQPETAVEGQRSEVVGFDVRLLATHEASRLEAPGCPACIDLLSGLRWFAERLVEEDAGAGAVDFLPEPAALRESTELRGADEVALTVRIYRDPGERAHAAPGEDPRLSALRQRLGAIGVPQHT